MKLSIQIEVDVTFVNGKFAAKSDIEEAVVELIRDSIDGQEIEPNEGVYTIEGVN